MLIVALAWIYVVLLMALTEPLIPGIMTFLLYCVLPLGILFYVTGGRRRKRRRAARRGDTPEH